MNVLKASCFTVRSAYGSRR